MKKNLLIIFGLTAVGLSGCLIGAEPFTFKNDADPNATVQPCLGGTAESSNGLCWREVSDGVQYGDIDTSIICQLNDGTGDWRLPSAQEYIRLLGNCANSDDELIKCDTCQESPICAQVFPNLESSDYYTSNYYYLTSDKCRVDMDDGRILDSFDLDDSDDVKIMCVRPEPV